MTDDLATVKISAAHGQPPVVMIDGYDMAGRIRGYRIEHDTGDVPTLTLELPLEEIANYTGDVWLHMDAGCRELLIDHGWTPPMEDDQ